MTLLEQTRQDDLERAYMAFATSARSLERAYAELSARAARLDLELHEANGRLRAVLAALPAGVVASDSNGRITIINDSACRILGLLAPPAPGAWRLQELVDASGDPLLLPTAGPEDRLLPVRDGRGPRRVRIRSAPLPAGALWILEDRSEQERLEGEVQRLDRLAGLGRMALSIAHEIRNPLNAVAGFAGLLTRLHASGKERRYADRIVEGVRRVDAIIHNLLALARPGRRDFAPLDLAAAVRATLSEWSAGAVQACLPEGPALVRGDGAGVRRILENLLQNAVEAGGPEVPIEVGLAARAGSFLLWVEDGGPGIPQERRQEIFEPFRSGREGGTGLGLAIVRGLVEAQGGRVQAADAQRLGGVRFEILLPAMEGP